jgi:Carboxypeptidase regulatory-like domain
MVLKSLEYGSHFYTWGHALTMKVAAVYLLLVLAATVCSAHFAIGQVPFAAIKGKVTDPSDAVLSDTTLTIRDKQTNVQRASKTARDGSYQFESLDPGEYEMEVATTGFAPSLYALSLRAGDHLTLNVRLELGTVSQTVSVTGQLSGINTSDFSLNGSVGRVQMENLPLNGRNFLELAKLEPGVSVASVANPGALGNNYQRVSIAGSQYLETRASVDSSTADDRINGGSALNVSQESVQEFQISTFNFDLSTGATGSGAVNIITRRGGNDVHGSAFFYYRDHYLAAYPGLRRDPENPNPFFARRQSGFSVGGPILKDRFFWFTNLEHNNQDGVFAVTNNHPIFSKLDVVQPSTLNFNLLTLRLDANIDNRHTGFLRGNFDLNNSIAPSASTVSMPSNWFAARTRAGQYQAGLTSVLTPRFVSDLRISHSYLNNTLDALTAEECSAPVACVGIGGPDILVFDAPSFRLGHHVSVPKTMHTSTNQIVSNLTWQRGTHRLRFGGEWEHLNLNSVQAFYDPPQITLWGPTDLQRSAVLKPLYDALPATLKDPAAGPPTISDILRLPLRSFLIGIGNPLQPGPFHHDDASEPNLGRLYIEDGWAIHRRLTLSYGIAYLHRTGIYNQDLPRPGYLAPIVAGDLRPPHGGTTNLEPMAGLAWSLGKNGSTVLRAGAGIHHDDIDFFRPYLERGPLGPAGNERVMVDGSVAGLSFLSTPTSVAGQDLLPMLPDIRSMLTQKLGDGTNDAVKGIEVIKQGDRIFDPNHTTPSAIHVNAGIQQKLAANLTFSADYVARRFEHYGGFQAVFQLDRNRFNRPAVTSVNPSTGEVSFVRNPVIPLCSAAQAAALNPADQCSTGPINVYGSGANYLYQGLHAKLEGRFKSRLYLTVAYALGHNTGFVEFNDYDNYQTAYGTQPDDRRHRLTLSAIYDLPGYAKGSRPARAFLNGWTVALISENDSAPPLDTMLAGLDLNGDGISRTLLPGITRHNTLGRGLSPTELRILVDRYNADVEARTRRVTNADGSVTVIRPRTPFNQIINVITLPDKFSSGDSFITQDLRITRKVNIGESYTLALMGEVFNLFNIANLSGYNNMLNQVNYGTPSTRAGQVFGSGGPRAFQFATRLQF